MLVPHRTTTPGVGTTGILTKLTADTRTVFMMWFIRIKTDAVEKVNPTTVS